MNNSQNALRNENSHKMALRGVQTSFLMFPVRLETKFREKTVNDIYEPDRAYYCFCALWAVLRLLKNSPEEKILAKTETLKEEIEGLDLIYKEDKALLRDLLTRTGEALRSEKLREAWAPLSRLLEDVSTSPSVIDNRVSIFLNKLEKYTRLLENTVNNIPYNGVRRFTTDCYSKTVMLRTGLRHFRKILSYLRSIKEEIAALPAIADKAQTDRFNRCLDRIEALKDKDLFYSYNHVLMAMHRSPYIKNESSLNKAFFSLKDFIKGTMTPFLRSIDYSSLRKDFNTRRRTLGKKDRKFSRYTVLASSLMHLYLQGYVCGRDIDRPAASRRIAALCRNSRFNYRCEKKWTAGLLEAISSRVGLDIPKAYLDENDSLIKNSHMGYMVRQKSLCVRIYPDTASLAQMVRPLTEDEFELGRQFWTRYGEATDQKSRDALWLGMCDLMKAHRAAYVLKQSHAHSSFEEIRQAVDEDRIFTVPMTELMPDRFALIANLKLSAGKTRTIWHYGHRLPSRLQVGLDLNELDGAVDEAGSRQSGQLLLNGSLRWMTDYDEAERMGMAVTLPLKAVQKGRRGSIRKFEFESVFVYGILDNNEDQCEEKLRNLISNQLYSESSFSILDADTPTNILTDEDENHLFDSSDAAQADRFKVQPELCLHPFESAEETDAQILEKLFRLNDGLISGFDSPQQDILLMRKVNRILLEALSPVSNLINFINGNEKLKDYFVNDVLPRGAFPFFRIGDQPYGVLPACDFKYLCQRRQSWVLSGVKRVLTMLTRHWNAIVSSEKVAYDGDESRQMTDRDYLNILSCTPSSTTIWKRKMVKSSIVNPEYFRGMKKNGQLMDIVTALFEKDRHTRQEEDLILSIFPEFETVPLLVDKDDDMADSVVMGRENAEFPRLLARLRNEIPESEASDEKLRNCIVEFHDLFSYRIDAWLMGLLNNSIRQKIDNGEHRIVLGCYGWVFNLKESPLTEDRTNEYILAPSINHALTGAVLRSSYNNSCKNGDRDYDMSVNLSSERVRSALRIIEGIRNGLSLGSILGCDLERLIHEAYKSDARCELDSCIYPLRTSFPLVTQNKGTEGVDSISVLNGASLLKLWRNAPNKRTWLESLELFSGSNRDIRYDALSRIIDRVDDEYDALTDVVLSESIYKLAQGNREAVDALRQAMDQMKHIPDPEIVNIPVASAQIDGHMVIALNTEAVSDGPGLFAKVEPKVDEWICRTIASPEEIGVAFGIPSPSGTILSCSTLGELGVSASELVYLSADRKTFEQFLKASYCLKDGVYPEFVSSAGNAAFTLEEVLLPASHMRELLEKSRILRNDDLVKETGHSCHASYDTLEAEYYKVHEELSRLSSRINAILEKQDAPSGNALLREAFELMTECFRTGQMTALDCEESRIISHLDTLNANMLKKIAEAEDMIAKSSEKDDKAYGEAIRHMLVPYFLTVPSFRPDSNVDTGELLDQCSGNRYSNIGPLDLEHYLTEMSAVEEPMMHIHQLRMFGKCNDREIPRLAAVQFPVVKGSDGHKEWLAMEVSDESLVRDAFTYVVMNPENFKAPQAKDGLRIAGIVADHWIERIPYSEQTAAVTFNYDQPDAEAPQSLLLAVSTKHSHRWSEKMMINTMKSAIHMVKCRTVTPELLGKKSWTSGIFPLIEYKDIKND